MDKKLLSQEALKVIACATMLTDHIGAVFFPDNLWLRIIGRLAFPIYCFLLAEGAHYTKNPTKYALRLLIGMLLSEIPFDLCLYGKISWAHQSVMVTLLLAYVMVLCIPRFPKWGSPFIAVSFALLAELLNTDYGAMGVLLVAVFYISRGTEQALLLQAVGLCLLSLWKFMNGNILQFFAILAIVPIALYSGKKATSSPVLQWVFYLFYPVHLTVLWLVSLVSS